MGCGMKILEDFAQVNDMIQKNPCGCYVVNIPERAAVEARDQLGCPTRVNGRWN